MLMSARIQLQWVLYMFLALGQVLGATAATQSSKPHLIFMVADDFGWNDIGLRNPDIYSPNLNDLAHSGIILNHSYVVHLCTPSRAAFMTGYYPFRNGMQSNVIDLLGPTGLSTQFQLLPERLAELGYDAHMVGKWHLGSCNASYLPNARGFKTFFGLWSAGGFYYEHGFNVTLNSSKPDVPDHTFLYDFWNQSTSAWEYNGKHSSIPYTLQVQHILNTWDGETPLFLYLPFQLTHAPLQVDPIYEQRYENITNVARRIFSAMVSTLDDEVGKILALLKQSGVYDNSVIVFTADNGAEVLNGGNNYPLRGSKYTMWEGATRATAFVHSPLLTKKGYTYDGLIHAVDWYPTFVSLAGGDLNSDMDGVDVWEAIVTNDKSPRTRFVYNLEYIEGKLNGAIREGDWKLILGKAGLPVDRVAPENVTGKYANTIGEIYNMKDVPGAPPYRLFNITDPTESHDVAEQNEKVVRDLMAIVAEYRNQMVYTVYQPHNDIEYSNRVTNFTYLSTDWCQAISEVFPMPKIDVSDIENAFLRSNL